jgi:hypothetical protein
MSLHFFKRKSKRETWQRNNCEKRTCSKVPQKFEQFVASNNTLGRLRDDGKSKESVPKNIVADPDQFGKPDPDHFRRPDSHPFRKPDPDPHKKTKKQIFLFGTLLLDFKYR